MTEYEQRSDGFTAIEDQYACYTVYDPDGSKIGKVDDVFLDETDQPEYIGVKMGFLGTSSTLIPMDIVTVDQTQSTMTVSPSPRAPSRTGRPSTTGRSPPEYEREVRSFYGLPATDGESTSYGDYYADSGAATTGATSKGTVGDRA